jgi:hypothetical protein
MPSTWRMFGRNWIGEQAAGWSSEAVQQRKSWLSLAVAIQMHLSAHDTSSSLQFSLRSQVHEDIGDPLTGKPSILAT